MTSNDKILDLIKDYSSGKLSGWHKPTGLDVKKQVMSGALPMTGYFDSSRITEVFGDSERVDTFPYRARIQLWSDTGRKPWKPWGQRTGICVGCGHQGAVENSMAVMAQWFGYRFPGRPALAPIYAGSRVEIGQNPGRWEGSSGAWAADWLLKFGVLLNTDIGLDEDDQERNESLANEWAASRRGVPDEFEPIARTRPIKGWTIAKTPEECGLALQHGLLVTHCSNDWCDGVDREGFGIIRSHNGGHCQYWHAVMWQPNGKIKGLRDQNSWFETYCSESKIVGDEPPGGVWEREDAVYRRIEEGETIILSPVDGVELDKLDYSFIKR